MAKTLRDVEGAILDLETTETNASEALKILAAWRSQAEALVRRWNQKVCVDEGTCSCHEECADALAKLIGED